MKLPFLAILLAAAACAQKAPPAVAHADRAPAASASSASPLAWPLDGRLSSGFGQRGASRHKGIDLRVAPGTPIRSAAAGVVSFSDRQRGYGRVVIVRHATGLETRYAHNRRNLVRKGQTVRRGQVIAEAGSSGNATAPHLHFEVRVDGKPRDPLLYLPKRATTRR